MLTIKNIETTAWIKLQEMTCAQAPICIACSSPKVQLLHNRANPLLARWKCSICNSYLTSTPILSIVALRNANVNLRNLPVYGYLQGSSFGIIGKMCNKGCCFRDASNKRHLMRKLQLIE